jgi:hypothetical protein
LIDAERSRVEDVPSRLGSADLDVRRLALAELRSAERPPDDFMTALEELLEKTGKVDNPAAVELLRAALGDTRPVDDLWIKTLLRADRTALVVARSVADRSSVHQRTLEALLAVAESKPRGVTDRALAALSSTVD